MKEILTVLKSSELCGQQFTLYGSPDEPLFFAQDVARLINHSDVSTMLRRVEDDERVLMTNPNNVCGGQNAWFLTESGLYEVLMQSRKPIAKQFKREVKAILKEIRTQGGYVISKPEETPEEIMARAIMVAQNTINRQKQMIAEHEAKIDEQKQVIERQQPMVTYTLDVLKSTTCYTFTQMAKELDFRSAVSLKEELKKRGILYTRYDYDTLKSPYAGQGYTKTRTFVVNKPNGERITKLSTVFTEKGRAWLHCLLDDCMTSRQGRNE